MSPEEIEARALDAALEVFWEIDRVLFDDANRADMRRAIAEYNAVLWSLTSADRERRLAESRAAEIRWCAERELAALARLMDPEINVPPVKPLDAA